MSLFGVLRQDIRALPMDIYIFTGKVYVNVTGL